MTREIKELAHWLTEAGCEMAAMESTGLYWKPLYNLFELMGLDAMIVNAAHMKAVPRRKTDVKDAEWIADLLQHGLLRASFVPSREQGELRELTRYRKSGRYSPIWPNGKKHARNAYAHSEAECETLLAEMILEMKAEISAEKERIKTAPKAS